MSVDVLDDVVLNAVCEMQTDISMIRAGYDGAADYSSCQCGGWCGGYCSTDCGGTCSDPTPTGVPPKPWD